MSEKSDTPRTDAELARFFEMIETSGTFGDKDSLRRGARAMSLFSKELEYEVSQLTEQLKKAQGEVWRPITTVPLGEMVMLWGGGWRHEFAGQVCDRYTGLCVLDSPTPEHKVADHYAQFWRPLAARPKEPHSKSEYKRLTALGVEVDPPKETK